MDKIGILCMGPLNSYHYSEIETQKRYEELSDKYIFSSEKVEFMHSSDIPPVVLPSEAPPIKICEFSPTSIEQGSGRSVMNEEYYQKQIAKRRKKNKNKRTHRK